MLQEDIGIETDEDYGVKPPDNWPTDKDYGVKPPDNWPTDEDYGVKPPDNWPTTRPSTIRWPFMVVSGCS